MNKKGFSLIELLVIIVIVGVISLIAGFGYKKISDSANEKALKAKKELILNSAIMYGNDKELLINKTCTVNNENYKCLKITVGELIDASYYKTNETCKNNNNVCVYNDVTKELMNKDEIVIYKDIYGIEAGFSKDLNYQINQ